LTDPIGSATVRAGATAPLKEIAMPKYLASFDYSATGTQGLLKDGGSQREKAVTAAVNALGGKVEAFYFAFGQSDAILILDLPDNVTAAALSLVVSATGAGAIKTTPLLTPMDIDAAAKMKVSYRAPGA
jgi:uncharacterized protein with GYD domain